MNKLKVGMLALALTGLVGSRADAAAILVFGQTGTGGVGMTATNGGPGAGATTISATNVGVTITAIENGVAPIAALFNFTATNTTQAVLAGPLDNQIAQGYSGTFSITGGGNNYLSGTFTGSLVSGLNGGTSLTFTAAQPPTGLNFTSSIITTLGVPRALSLSFANVSPAAAIIDVDGTAGTYNTIRAFTSNVSGDASAASTVPEPASLLVLGVGLIGAAVRARRRS